MLPTSCLSTDNTQPELITKELERLSQSIELAQEYFLMLVNQKIVDLLPETMINLMDAHGSIKKAMASYANYLERLEGTK